MLYRRRAMYSAVAATAAALILLGLILGTFTTASSETAGPASASTDPALSAVVDQVLPARAAAVSQVESVQSRPHTTSPDAVPGTVYLLRAACAGSGSVRMRLTDGSSSVQTRLRCSSAAAEQRTIQLTAATTAVTGEFEPDGAAEGVVSSQLLKVDDDRDPD